MDEIFETRDLHLATWMWYQPGVELRGIKTDVKRGTKGRDGRPQCLSTFQLDLTNSVRSKAELFAIWLQKDPAAFVEVNEYEDVRRTLLEAMRESHREATDGND